MTKKQRKSAYLLMFGGQLPIEVALVPKTLTSRVPKPEDLRDYQREEVDMEKFDGNH